jgi:nucleoside phosphorylase
MADSQSSRAVQDEIALQQISPVEARSLRKQVKLVVLTATKKETDELVRLLSPLPGYKSIALAYNGANTFHIGMLGCYGTAHVQCAMGSIGRDASILTASESIRFWRAKAVIMAGLAFGMKSAVRSIGDVLVSSTIAPYEPAREGETSTQRGVIVEAGPVLLDRFRNHRGWKYPIGQDRQSEIHVGQVLSGEKLVDNSEFLLHLQNTFPNAIGGEMEGAGLYAAAARAKIEWIVVKAICDWADGTKNKEFQTLAASASCSFCKSVLSDPYSLAAIGIQAVQMPAAAISRSADATVVFVVTVSSSRLPEVGAILRALQKIAGKDKITIRRVEHGSIRLVLEGTQRAFETIQDHYHKGLLGKAVRGMVEEVRLLPVSDHQFITEPESKSPPPTQARQQTGVARVYRLAVEYAWTARFWKTSLHEVISAQLGKVILWHQKDSLSGTDSVVAATSGGGLEIVTVLTARHDVYGLLVDWAYAHELAHFALGHFDVGSLQFGPPDSERERDADAFALAYMRTITEGELASVEVLANLRRTYHKDRPEGMDIEKAIREIDSVWNQVSREE